MWIYIDSIGLYVFIMKKAALLCDSVTGGGGGSQRQCNDCSTVQHAGWTVDV